MINARLRIRGSRPHFEKILMKFLVYDFKIDETGQDIFLSVMLPTMTSLMELKRRLGGKHGRATRVTIVEMGGSGGNK